MKVHTEKIQACLIFTQQPLLESRASILLTIKRLRNYQALKKSAEAIQKDIEDRYDAYQSPSFESIGSHGNEVSDPTARAVRQINFLKDKLRTTVS